MPYFSNGGCNQGEITADIDRRNYDRAMSAIDADATMSETYIITVN